MVKKKKKARQLPELLEEELQWFERILISRFQQYFDLEGSEELIPDPLEISPPKWPPRSTQYGAWLDVVKPDLFERVALGLCLTSCLRPQMLDLFFTKNGTYDRPMSQFGGYVSSQQSPFIPTGETLLFLLAGDDLSLKIKARGLLASNHRLIQDNILSLGPPTVSNRPASGVLQLTEEKISQWIDEQPYRPEFSRSFPAQRLITRRKWEDLVLPRPTLKQLEEIRQWVLYEHTLMEEWQLSAKLRPGFRALFHGPPGTGKTMAATLLGQVTGKDVYRVDLSLLVSKYIGETEKNLANVFRQAEHKQWILFFDEADAIFGKRTDVQSSHDRFANQEVAYLLQRIEQFDGIIILASNLSSNLDDAFLRRFESMVYFPVPAAQQRLQLWQQSLPDQKLIACEPALIEKLPSIAHKYELTGGAIMNVVRLAALRAASQSDDSNKKVLQPSFSSHCSPYLRLNDIMDGIKTEYGKEGKVV